MKISGNSIFLILLGLAFVGLGVMSLRQTNALLESKSVATAVVTESRISPTKRETLYEVRYLLAPNAQTPPVGRSDFFGRKDLWSSLPEEEWDQANKTKRLAVRYDPANISNNAPVAQLPKAYDAWAAIGGGGLLLLCLIFIKPRAKA